MWWGETKIEDDKTEDSTNNNKRANEETADTEEGAAKKAKVEAAGRSNRFHQSNKSSFANQQKMVSHQVKIILFMDEIKSSLDLISSLNTLLYSRQQY